MGNKLAVATQCQLLSVSSSRYYYKHVVKDDSGIANAISECYQKHPVYGYRRITACLRRLGYVVNRKCVLRLMREMGLKAIYPGVKTTIANQAHTKYAYALQDMAISQPHQAWQIDITYLRTAHGFIYLNALIDMHSRYVVGWTLSNSLDTESCLRTLEQAVYAYGTPLYINSDQGSQFTCGAWVTALQEMDIKISMSGKGRSNDNAHIERLWRTLKYESVILNDPRTITDYKKLLPEFMHWYNEQRPHQALNYQTPDEVLKQQASEVVISANHIKLAKTNEVQIIS
jgi:putative transposase